MSSVVLTNGAVFDRPEERIRRYCEVEVYRDRNFKGGYDDHLAVTDSITAEDVDAANNLHARISQLERGRLIHSEETRARLAGVGDADLGGLSGQDFARIEPGINALFLAVLSVPQFRIGATTKVLHLKRPRLFPVIDSHVARFLTGNDMEENRFSVEEHLKIGMQCLRIARTDLDNNKDGFAGLQRRLADLPTPLPAVRMYDILCWTQEKWINRGDVSAPYDANSPIIGAILQSPRGDNQGAPGEPEGEIHNIKEFRQVKLRAEGVIVNTGAKPPRAHRPLCRELTEERFQEAVVFNEGKKGKYYLRGTLKDAVKDFGAVACMKCKPERPVVSA